MKVALFVTCLVNLFRPQIAFAAVKLLEQAECTVIVPEEQTCCGQPAYNNGDRKNAISIAKKVITVFQHFDYVVVPSGSCAGMIIKHYSELFQNDLDWVEKAKEFASKTFELITFLTDVLKITNTETVYAETVTYHDSCSGLRELNIKKQPRQLLSSVKGLTLKELPDCEVCCGFGGTFCVKYPDISNKMVADKVTAIQSTEAQTVLAGDLGCLLNIEGKLKRLHSKIKVLHIAEVLAGK